MTAPQETAATESHSWIEIKIKIERERDGVECVNHKLKKVEEESSRSHSLPPTQAVKF